MRMLVPAATRHGATGGITQAVADTPRDQGLDPTVLEPEQVDGVDGFATDTIHRSPTTRGSPPLKATRKEGT